MASEDTILRLKRELKARAAAKFPGDQERQNAYVWGTIRHIQGTRKGE